MLLLQARKLRPKLAFFLFCHRRLGCAWARDFVPKCLWILAFWLIPTSPSATDGPWAPRCRAGIFTGTETEYPRRSLSWCRVRQQFDARRNATWRSNRILRNLRNDTRHLSWK